MSSSRAQLGFLLGLAGILGFSSTLPVTRLAVGSLDPLFLTAGRATLAGFLAVAVLIVFRCKLPPQSIWVKLAITTVCTLVAYPVFLALALKTVPASHGGVVLGVTPLAIAATAALLGYERPSGGFWIVSAVGAFVVIAFVMRHAEARTVATGDIFLLGTVIAAAVAYTLSGRLSLIIPAWQVITWQLAIFTPFAFAAAFFLWPNDAAAVPTSAWTALIWVSFVGQYFAFVAFNAAMAMGGVARVGQLTLLQPFLVLAIAVPVNQESFDPETVLFAAGVVATVLVGQRMRVARQ